MWKLGLFQHMDMFKIRKNDSEDGYDKVVKSGWNYGGAAAFLSLFGPSVWSREASKYRFVHAGSPHFFHMSKYVPMCTGTVTDMFYLDQLNRRDNPLGFRTYFKRVMRYVDKLAGVVTISAATERRVKELYPKANTRTIHLWTSPHFNPRDRNEARERLQLPKDKIILLSVSSDIRRKNIEILPPILESLGPDYLLLRIGPSGIIESKFRKGALLSYPSVSDELYPLFFNAADVFLMPSRDEGFGIPIIEAVNSGIPVVASDVAVFQEILRKSYPFYANPDKPDDWVGKVREATARYAGKGGIPSIYNDIGDYYREGRALKEFSEFFKKLGVT
jgi:glycosyltransferase involved in cell wall biosynthesis